MDKCVLGKVIDKYKSKYKVTQKVIHEGIGSQGSYQRGEYTDRDVDFIIQETMLARVGRGVESFEVILGDEEYDKWALRMSIRSAMAAKDYDFVAEKVRFYRENHSEKHKLHEQFCQYYEMKLACLRGEKAEVVGPLAERALNITKKVDDMPLREDSLYTPMELDCLLVLIQCRYGCWEDQWRCVEGLRKIIEYAKIYFSLEKREEIEGKARIEQIKIMEQFENTEKLLLYVNEAITCFSGATGIERLAEVRFIKARLLWKGYANTAKQMEQKKSCMQECLMAYSIYEALGREEKMQEIEIFCVEELQWHITMQI